MKHIFELRMKDQIEERSSQLLRNLSSFEKNDLFVYDPLMCILVTVAYDITIYYF